MTHSSKKPSAAFLEPGDVKKPVEAKAMLKTHMRKHPPTRRGRRPMYSHAMSEEKIDTIKSTKVMIVTRNGSAMPATLKKYYMGSQ